MTVSNTARLTALLALALATAACQRAPAPDSDAGAGPELATPTTPAEPAPAAAETATLPGTDVTEAVDNGPLDPGARTVAGVDIRQFAGVFSAEGARIEFRADGSYAMTVHAASADADLASGGTWTAEAGGSEILLDSDDKSESDRRYAVVSRDEIRQIEPGQDAGGQVLRRENAP